MLFDRYPEYRTKWGDRHFWARRYYASMIEIVNEEVIIKYIQKQEDDTLESFFRRQPVKMVLRNPAFGGNWKLP